jgi:alkyldihydroxyacetonephosphate synthase
MTSRRSWWGWGYENAPEEPAGSAALQAALARLLQLPVGEPVTPPRLEDLNLRPSRIDLPADLRAFCSHETYDRAAHCYGKSYRDVVRALHGEVGNPPDFVAYPRDESQIRALMAFAEANAVALVPYGGGTSVVGGVEPTTSSQYQGVVTVDLRHLDRLLEVDARSHSARVQAGMLGPALEAGLGRHGFTLRHFPQSFECSSVGGWIATRAGGHFATGYTHIDDHVQAIRMLTPAGVHETRRVPSSGAGPSPDRLWLGSEGTLGVITEAWLRVQPVPAFRSAATVRFTDAESAIDAVRAIAQSGLRPANCRLLSPLEAGLAGVGDGGDAVLLLGLESHDHPLDAAMARVLDLCARLDGRSDADNPTGGTSKAGQLWRRLFTRAPYERDRLVARGLLVETYESAVTWSGFEAFHRRVMDAAEAAVTTACGRGLVSWRIAYAYPDGPAPYYTVVAPARRHHELEQWTAIKAAVSDAMLEAGGTITHHHAVGRVHRAWYAREQSGVFLSALRSAKQAVDPHWILNPGVLVSREPDQRPGFVPTVNASIQGRSS